MGSTFGPVSWRECLGHVKFWRAEVKRSMGEPINQIEIVEESDGTVKLYALAKTSDDGNAQQTVVQAVVPLPKPDDEAMDLQEPPQLLLRSLFNGIANTDAGSGEPTANGEKMSTELCLFYERMRCQSVNGITQYAISGDTFLLSSPANLCTYTASTKQFSPVGSYISGSGLNAAFSPVDGNYVAFAHVGQLYIDKHNESVFATPLESGRTCGVASFVAQEEFERYEGFWWSPTRVEVLYERVDESEVDELSFAVPGAIVSADSTLRYPLAGRTNSTSTLSICHINVQYEDGVLDVACQANLRRVVPWYEYLVRCGWTADGENVWVCVMNRAQTQLALLLLPRIVFCAEIVENADEFVKIVYEEKSNTWINFNNHTQFLPNEPDGMLRTIIGSEKRNFCHLYLHIFNITYGEPTRLEEIDEDAVVQDFGAPPPYSAKVVTALEARTTDALPSLAEVAPVPPPVHIITSDQVAEMTAYPLPLPPSVFMPTPVSTASGERRSSLTVRRLSQHVGVLSDQRDLPITSADDGEWAIYRDAPIVVDHRRQHVYYVCSRAATTIVSLAVSSYGIPTRESRVLTPEDLSYKIERSQSSLSVNPDHGFACWVSNARTMPECRFYRLIHKCTSPLAATDMADGLPFFSSLAELPTAVFAYRIGIDMTCTNPLASIMPPSRGSEQAAIRSIGALPQVSQPTAADRENTSQPSANGQAALYCSPSSLFHSRFFAYQSRHSGRTHYALLLWPTDATAAALNGRAAGATARKRSGRFPVLHAVYAGPHVQLVRDNWQNVANYMKFLSVGFAVLFVDGRGSANRGVDFEAPIKNAFGGVELQDQVEGLETVAALAGENLLDLSNVVVTGWSYGGYISVLLLANYPDVYRAACAGGAVSDWTLYDTAYTERYAGEPREHEAQYRASSLQTHITKLPDEDNRLLLVHGLLDENVHFRHTEKLLNGIIAAGKPHQLLLLPNERHTVRSGDAIEYFHTRMLIFLLNALST